MAREGDIHTILKLLDRITSNQQRKKKINQKDDVKLAPLHYASRYSHYKIMRILIDNGAGQFYPVLMVLLFVFFVNTK